MAHPKDDVQGLVHDGRLPPFCYQEHTAIDLIRAYYSTGKPYGKFTSALGVYVVFTEAANKTGGHTARGGFKKRRTELAKLALLSVNGFDNYVKVLVEIGVLSAKQVQVEGINLPNEWMLTPSSGLGGYPSGVGEGSPSGVGESPSPLGTKAFKEVTTLEIQPEEEDLNLEAADATSPNGTSKASTDLEPRGSGTRAATARKRNLPFDALVQACPGTDPTVDGGMVAKALKEIRQRCVTEAQSGDPRGQPSEHILFADEHGDPRDNHLLAIEIKHRATLYRQRWPEVELTPTALAKHWTRLLTEKPKGAKLTPGSLLERFNQ